MLTKLTGPGRHRDCEVSVKSGWKSRKKDKVIESGKGDEIYKSELAKSISNLCVFHPLAVFHSGAQKLL